MASGFARLSYPTTGDVVRSGFEPCIMKEQCEFPSVIAYAKLVRGLRAMMIKGKFDDRARFV